MISLIIWIILAVWGWIGVAEHSTPTAVFWGMAIIGTVMLVVRLIKAGFGDGDFFEDLVDTGDGFFESIGGDSSGGGSWGGDD